MSNVSYPIEMPTIKVLNPSELKNIRNNNKSVFIQDRNKGQLGKMSDMISKYNNRGKTRLHFENKLTPIVKHNLRKNGYKVGKETKRKKGKIPCVSKEEIIRFIDWSLE